MATPEENLYQAAASILGGAITTAIDNNWTDEQAIEYAIKMANDLAGEVKKTMNPEPVEQKP